MTETASENVTIRQNFDESSESLLNQLINVIFFGNYTFHSMAYYFDRVDIGLTGFADLNLHCAIDAYKTVRKLMDYVVLRGGQCVFDDIKKPEKQEWGTPLDSLEYLLNYKKLINEMALKCHQNAENKRDAHLTDFLETEVLEPMTSFIRKVGILISNLKKAGPGLGKFQIL